MQKQILIPLLALCMCLFAPVSKAFKSIPRDTEQRQGMSYEEYSAYRENMRLHLERNKAVEHQSSPESANRVDDKTENPKTNTTYGRGYHSRTTDENKAETQARPDRPERPRMERFNRRDMMRR